MENSIQTDLDFLHQLTLVKINNLIMKNKMFYIIISIVLIVVTTISIMNWFNINKLSKHHEIKYPEYSYAYDCVREAQLKYYETKSLLCDEVQKYINSIAPSSNLRGYAVVEECEKYNIDIKFVLAQGEIESHFATKGIGSKLNNVFNVGVFDGLTSSDVKSNYKYNYPNESIRPYLELLTSRYLVNKLESDLMDSYVDINGNRYASDNNYESKLKERHTFIKMHTKIDSLQQQMYNYAIKCNKI